MSMPILSNQVALVTGASRGIGRAIALELARHGASVVGTATTEQGAESITQYLSALSATGKGVVLNVNDTAQVGTVIAGVQRDYGGLGILVNNAGVTKDTLAMRMSDEDWDVVLDTDLKSVFCLSRAVLRGMMKAKVGRIINITSVVGSSGNAGQVNYAAAKAGVAGMTRALAREVGSRNITVNCIAPGFIDTDMTRVLSDEQKASLLQTIPLGRLGNPEEIAAAVLFLASPAAAYITGTTLHVNGGMYMS
jgi:3-oxoacyl-[acyl-carrier protein] reductase